MKINIDEQKGPSICRLCRRKLGRAVQEQVQAKSPCLLPTNQVCIFEEQIKDELDKVSFKVRHDRTTKTEANRGAPFKILPQERKDDELA